MNAWAICPRSKKIFGAVVQLGLGRQIVNLEVAGSNPVGPAIPHLSMVYYQYQFPPFSVRPV